LEILKDRYSITELSRQLNVTDHTLRYYEKEFKLYIPKDNRGRRYYEPEHANIMYQIKSMRDEGLEIKAIKKILESQNIISDPPPVAPNQGEKNLITIENENDSLQLLKEFFDDFREQLTSSISIEVASAREEITMEISRSKMEIGACVENGTRKLESRMDKHFIEVDRLIGEWREKNKPGIIKQLYKKIFP